MKGCGEKEKKKKKKKSRKIGEKWSRGKERTTADMRQAQLSSWRRAIGTKQQQSQSDGCRTASWLDK
jgi:hypothetical protein